MKRPVSALLLAAGRSRRMGCCKQLLTLGETTVIGRCLDTLRRGGVSDIIVVVSEEGGQVARAAESYAARMAVNHSCDGDMASSIRAGREFLDADVSGVLVVLCDYPLVRPATIEALAGQHRLFPDRIITPRYREQGGHPLLLARGILDELREGMTLRDLVRQDMRRVHPFPVDDPGILIDMDTPRDYLRICGMLDCPENGMSMAGS